MPVKKTLRTHLVCAFFIFWKNHKKIAHNENHSYTNCTIKTQKKTDVLLNTGKKICGIMRKELHGYPAGFAVSHVSIWIPLEYRNLKKTNVYKI